MSALPLAGWENFYVIVGSSAAALTGLNFVVVALGSESNRSGVEGAVSAFATPTIVHFGAVLLISAIVSAPWPSMTPVALGMTICGLAGMVYVGLVIGHSRRQTAYEPVAEDWIWHMILPAVAYAAVVIASIGLWTGRDWALFVIAAASLLLLFIGIHNAWDSATYMAYSRRHRAPVDEPADGPTNAT